MIEHFLWALSMISLSYGHGEYFDEGGRAMTWATCDHQINVELSFNDVY